jgi:hypothetical protein
VTTIPPTAQALARPDNLTTPETQENPGNRNPGGSDPTTRPPPPTIAPPPPEKVTRGTFATPAGGTQVIEKSITAAGAIENISLTLLCIVRDESGNHFPYATQITSGGWSADIPIGPPTISRSQSFTLLLSTATQGAVDKIRSAQKTKPDYNYNGLGPTLPEGIEILAEVGIVRKAGS